MTEEYRVIRSMLYDIIGGVSVANENIGYLLEYEHQRDIENQKLRDEITQLRLRLEALAPESDGAHL